jgi:hypothetical protein
MLANGDSFTKIAAAMSCYPGYINRWRQRFENERLPALEARVLAKTKQRPPDGSTHWSTRKLAKVLGISHVLVAHVWRRAGLQPHRLEPPQHAVVFAADEKTAIQAGAGPLGPGPAVVAGPRRTPRLRILPARDAVALRRPQHAHRGDHRRDGPPTYQRGISSTSWATS